MSSDLVRTMLCSEGKVGLQDITYRWPAAPGESLASHRDGRGAPRINAAKRAPDGLQRARWRPGPPR